MKPSDLLLTLFTGAAFAVGLALSGVTAPHVVLDAFRYDAGWDPRLWLMFAGAQLVTLPVSAWLARRGTTLRGEPLPVVPAHGVDRRLVVGAVVFGAGWGVAGICPGPAFATAASGGVHAGVAFAGLWIGILLHDVAHALAKRA